MDSIEQLLKTIEHRPWALPSKAWRYYQEWSHALFFHWKIPYTELRPLVPGHLNLDSYKGEYYVSIVAFTMEQIRPKNLPALNFVSSFHEINLRTYINNGNKTGVYFLNIEAHKPLSVFVARNLSSLPYEYADVTRRPGLYKSVNTRKKFALHVEFDVKELLPQKSALDVWLTERYCLYLQHNGRLYRFDVHHPEWQVKQLDVRHLHIDYKIQNLNLAGKTPDLMHYSDREEL